MPRLRPCHPTGVRTPSTSARRLIPRHRNCDLTTGCIEASETTSSTKGSAIKAQLNQMCHHDGRHQGPSRGVSPALRRPLLPEFGSWALINSIFRHHHVRLPSPRAEINLLECPAAGHAIPPGGVRTPSTSARRLIPRHRNCDLTTGCIEASETISSTKGSAIKAQLNQMGHHDGRHQGRPSRGVSTAWRRPLLPEFGSWALINYIF